MFLAKNKKTNINYEIKSVSFKKLTNKIIDLEIYKNGKVKSVNPSIYKIFEKENQLNMKVNLFFIGDNFYHKSGSLMSSLYRVDNKESYDWGFVQRDLAQGKEVNIRPANTDELKWVENKLEDISNKYEDIPQKGMF